MAAIGFFFVILPALAIIAFTGFAACRAQHSKVIRALAYPLLAFGVICGLPAVGVLGWFVLA